MKIILRTPIISSNIKPEFGALPPLGIGYLAAVLKKDKHNVKIIDPLLKMLITLL